MHAIIASKITIFKYSLIGLWYPDIFNQLTAQ